MKSSHFLFVLLFVVLVLPMRADEPAFLPKTRRIVFLGDSITYGGQYIESIEAYLVTRFPERQFALLNLGLPSETVSGLSEEGHAGGKFPRPDLAERLARVLEKTKPDLVIACYGMNDGIYQPFSEERFAKFQRGMFHLRERANAVGAKVLHVTPPTFDPDPKQTGKAIAFNYNDVLDHYSDWLLAQSKQGWDVVDLHAPMNRYLAARRQQDPKFFLAGDGVHANETGHWIMAKQILLHFGAKDLAAAEDPKAMLATYPNGEKLLSLIQQRQRMMKDAWLTETGHTRPGMNKGFPLAEAQAKAADLENQIQNLLR